MDAKDTWPVVKFLVSATGLKKKDARRLLQEIPEDRYGQLFLESRNWEREMLADAGKRLSNIVGAASLSTLVEATRRAQLSATEQNELEDEEEEEEEPRKRKGKATPPSSSGRKALSHRSV